MGFKKGKIKRFMVFGYETYYPGGGMTDFIDSFDTVEEALAAVRADAENNDTYDIFDTETGEGVPYG